jgi:hypothetical protein
MKAAASSKAIPMRDRMLMMKGRSWPNPEV